MGLKDFLFPKSAKPAEKAETIEIPEVAVQPTSENVPEVVLKEKTLEERVLELEFKSNVLYEALDLLAIDSSEQRVAITSLAAQNATLVDVIRKLSGSSGTSVGISGFKPARKAGDDKPN